MRTKVPYSLFNSTKVFDVTNYGVVADSSSTGGGTDNYAAFKLCADAIAANGGGIMYIPPGYYAITRTILILSSNTHVIGFGAVIFHTGNVTGATTPAYRNDGFRIGNKQLEPGKDEDATNPLNPPYTKTVNTHVEGLTFLNVRIGVWYVHCYACSGKDLSSDGAATVATGNDSADDCDQMWFRDITQLSFQSVSGYTGYIPKSVDVFYTIGLFQTDNFLIDGIQTVNCPHPGGSVNVQHVAIVSSNDGIVKNYVLDCVDNIYRGIDVSGSSVRTQFLDGIVKNASTGAVLFDVTNGSKNHTISRNTFYNCDSGINLSTVNCVIENNRTIDCTVDMDIATNGSRNIIRNNIFEADNVTQQIAGLYELQAWSGNIGGPSGHFYRGIDTVFPFHPRNVSATWAGPQAGVTGNGAYAVATSWTELEDEDSLFASGIFTLPSAGVGGWFNFEIGLFVTDLTVAATVVELIVNENNGSRRITVDYHEDYGTSHGNATVFLSGSWSNYIGPGGTVRFEVRVQGEANDTVAGIGTGRGYLSISENRS